MRAVELFENFRIAERNLDAAEERVCFCRAAATKASAVLGGECVTRTRDVSANENAVMRLMEAERSYTQMDQKYDEVRQQICGCLKQLPDSLDADILRLRYMEHKRMVTIAKELHLSRSNVYYRHENAMLEIENILQKQI